MGEAKRRAARGELSHPRGGHYDRDAEMRKLAGEIDQRVRQITAKVASISDRALTEQMLGFLPALHQIWTTTSDDTLANLCSEYPGFYRYAKAMEDAFEAQRRHPGQNPAGAGIEEFPDRLKTLVEQVLSQGAALEREMQDLIDRLERHAVHGRHVDPAAFGADVSRARDVAALHQQWVAGLDRLGDDAHAAGVSQPSRQLLAKVLGEVNTRIGALSERLMAVVLAGRAAASAPGESRSAQ